MAAQALYRKWRSRTFEEVIGQEHVTRTLRNALREGRIAHAYLFTGPRGTGKTSTARLLAKAVNCLHEDPQARPDNVCTICQAINQGALLDLIEIDAASNRGIDEIRDLRDKVNFAASQARYKVYVIDEVHMLTPEAFNALLKTLEEPPAHVIFVLATTEPHRIPDTVLSRCQRFDFRRIPTPQIVDRLTYILDQEGRAAEPAALEMIARSVDGCMRDAISLTDQLLSYGGNGITVAQVQAVRGTVAGQAIIDLVDMMTVGQAAEGLSLINQLAAEGVDLRQLALQLVAHLRAVLLTRVSGQMAADILTDLSPEQLEVIQAQAGRVDAAILSQGIRLFNQAGQEMRDSVQPQLALELAWLDALQVATEHAVAQPGASSAAAPGAVGEATAAPSPSISAAGEPMPSAASQTASAVSTDMVVELSVAATPVPDDQVVATLRSNWSGLLHAAEAVGGGSLRGALKTLRHVVGDGSDVYFAFESDFSRRVVERPANKDAVERLLSQLLGRSIRLHCQVGTQVTGMPAAPQSEPQEAPAARSEVSADPGTELADDPVVQHARRNLGAVPSSVSRGNPPRAN